jgi:hypothetical protein
MLRPGQDPVAAWAISPRRRARARATTRAFGRRMFVETAYKHSVSEEEMYYKAHLTDWFADRLFLNGKCDNSPTWLEAGGPLVAFW